MKPGLLTLFYLLMAFSLSAQTGESRQDDYLLYYGVSGDVLTKSDPVHDYRFKGEGESIGTMPFSFFLWSYKTFLSGQLASDCSFTPSCSRFSYRAIHEFGILKGIIMTADRLTRCNANAYTDAPKYLLDSDHAKVIDNPGFYRFSD